MTQLPLRPNVCMLIVNTDSKLFLGERYDTPGTWQFPQGGIEDHLSEEENVLRELKEEVGVEAEMLQIIAKLKTRNDYDWKTPPDYAVGRWRGQSQSFWVVKFLGKDEHISLEGQEPEFMAWRWCTIDEVLSLADPIRLDRYRSALLEFSQLILK